MSHPADLSRTLASLDEEGLRALSHVLSCPACSREAQRFLSDEPGGTAAALPTKDLARLERLADQVRRNQESLERFVIDLRNQRTPVHYLVRSRLECLVADHLSPAVRDLESIEETARGNYEAGSFPEGGE